MNPTQVNIEYENLSKLNAPFLSEYKEKVEKFLTKGWYILGDEVAGFEKEFATYTHSVYCIGVANGLDALVMGLKVFEFPAGSEVIVPSNTYIATILSIKLAGLVPVLVEPRITTYNINPDKIIEKITSKTVAVMPVHLYGKLCEMDSIVAIAEKYNLRIIEDCAQSHGATLSGKQAGTFGDIGAFSFYPTKNLGALGDAGALTTKNPELAEKLRAQRNYGSEKKYHNKYIGINSRLDEIQALFLRIKLKHLDSINSHKKHLAALYQNLISDFFIKPVKQEEYDDVFHIYNIRHERRDQLKEYLKLNGINTEIHYPVPPHQQEAYRNIWNDSFPISEEIHSTTLSLPISYFHTEEDVYRICDVLNNFSKL
jgi:dTDP-4-amino-4,6-dideoxygalactose transaminase